MDLHGLGQRAQHRTVDLADPQQQVLGAVAHIEQRLVLDRRAWRTESGTGTAFNKSAKGCFSMRSSSENTPQMKASLRISSLLAPPLARASSN